MSTWHESQPGTDYDNVGRIAAINAIAAQLDQFEMTPVTPARIAEALQVLDLIAAAAIDASRATQPGAEFSPAHAQWNWARTYASTLPQAYDLVNQVGAVHSTLHSSPEVTA